MAAKNKTYRSKNKNAKLSEQTDNSASFSVIVPVEEASESLQHLKQSLIDSKGSSGFSLEVVLACNKLEGEFNNIPTEIEQELADDKQITCQSIITSKKTSKTGLLKQGLEKATNSTVVLFSIDALADTFNLGNIRNIKNKLDKNIILEFITPNEENEKKVGHTGIYILDRSVALYILNSISETSPDFEVEFRWLLENYNLTIEPVELKNDKSFNPGKKKVSFVARVTSYYKRRYNWLITNPLRENKLSVLKNNRIGKEAAIYRFAYTVFAAVLFFLMPIMGLKSGISGDEYVNYTHAKYVIDYFKTGGEDTLALHTPKTKLQYYGQSFDNLTAIFNETFGIDKIYETRHVFNSISGWLAILFASLIAVSLLGWRAGIITLILMFLSPRFIGHSWNNPKDIPFAMAYIFTVYHMIQFLKKFPVIKWRNVVWLAFGIALAISVRIGGLLLIAYLFMFSGLYFLFSQHISNIFKTQNLERLLNLLMIITGASIVGYFLGLVLWPYALQNPLKNPLESLTKMTNFSASLRQVFEGKIIWSDMVPWYYSLKYILITVPVVIFVGFFIQFFNFIFDKNRSKFLYVFILLFAAIFPIIYIIYKKSNVYGGWRHLIFAYPPLVALSGMGIEILARQFKNKFVQIGFFIVILASLFGPIRHIIVNHPYEYIYYNKLIGGVPGAYGKYEMDYYYHSLREASEWLIENKIENIDKEFKVTGNARIGYYFRSVDNVKGEYTRYYDRGNQDWDYAIFANSYINPYQLSHKIWPTDNTIHTIDVDGKPICSIVERRDKNDHYGFVAMQNKDYQQAIQYFLKSYKADPKNEILLLNMSKFYLTFGQYDEALKYAAELLEFYPNYDKALHLVGICYLQKRQVNRAEYTFKSIVKQNPKFVSAYHYLGVIEYQKNDYKKAMDYLNTAIKTNGNYKASYILAADILRKLGKNADAEKYANAAKRLP